MLFQALWSEGNQEEVIGNLKYGQQFVNVSGQKVDYRLPNGTITQVRNADGSVIKVSLKEYMLR